VRACVLSFDSGSFVQVARSNRSVALAAALRGGHNEISAALLDAGVHPDAWGEDERTPIFAAVEAGNVAGVELMVSRGADLGVTDNEDYAALDRALETGHCAVVERLLDAGADTGVGDTGSLFYGCASGGSVACLSSVLEALPRRLGRSLTPSELAEGLCGAVSYGTEAMVRRLLAAGAPPNGNGGYRPLRDAAMSGKPAMIRVLMEAGADPEASGLDAEVSALVWMAVGCADRVREALARLPSGSPLQRFSSACRFGRTWLTLAAMSGSRECVELAWERGAYREDGSVCSTICQLSRESHVDAVRLVLGVAADRSVNISPLLLADYCLRGEPRSEVIALLLEAGCSVNAHPSASPCHTSAAACVASLSKSAEPLELLLSRGARLDGVFEPPNQSWWLRAFGTLADWMGVGEYWGGVSSLSMLGAAVASTTATAAKIECVLRHMPPHTRPAQSPAGWHNLQHGDAIRALVSAYPTLPHARLPSDTDRGRTGLHCAALMACASAVEGWLSVGADPLCVDEDGMRPRDVVGDALLDGAMRLADVRACGALLLRAEGWARRRVAVVSVAM